MREPKLLILSIQEAKEMLGKFYVDMLINDPQHTYEMIVDGSLKKFVPDMIELSPGEIVELLGGDAAGMEVEKLVKKTGAELILVETDDYTYEAIWDARNCDPPNFKSMIGNEDNRQEG